MLNKILSLSLCLLIAQFSMAQVAISDNVVNPVPDSSAILDLQSISKGFLAPRLSQAERDAIANPADYLVIVNTSTGCLQAFMPLAGWVDIKCDCAALPNASFTSPATINQFASASFNATLAGASSYNWSFQGATPSSSNAQNPSVSWSGTGSFVVSLTVVDGQGCSSTSYDTVTVGACIPPSAAFTAPSTAYIGTPASFSANSPGLNYNWSFASASPASSTSSNPSVTWSAAGTYAVTLIVTNANGCPDTSTQNITVQSCVPNGSMTFNYTGSPQFMIAPAACGNLTFQCWGASGGNSTSAGNCIGGDDGYATGEMSVNPGDTIWVYVGEPV
jgi:PKD repeat protein